MSETSQANPEPNSRLSKHFTLQELVRSQTATRHGLDNTPGAAQYFALGMLCDRVLEPIRELLSSPIAISSGYRSPVLNRMVGGAPTSQHVRGEAADFTVLWLSNSNAVEVIRRAVPAIPFDQLILEGGDAGWVHVSFASGRPPRGQVLSASFTGRGVIYRPLEARG